jgi:hypothetical protein
LAADIVAAMDAAALRPLGIGEILDAAIKIYRARFTTLLRAVVFVVAPVQVVAAVINASVALDRTTTVEPGTELPALHASDFWAFAAGTLVATVLVFIASQLASAASFKAISGVYLGEETDWRGTLQFARQRLRSLIWLAILTGLALVLGLVLCIAPGVYLWGAFAVATPVLLLEDLRGRRALGRSRQLVRGHWWPVFFTVLLGVLLTAIVSGLLRAPLVALVISGSQDSAAGITVRAIIDTVAAVITTPFTAAVVTVLYFDLRVRKEGFDLELLARNVGIEPSVAAPTSFLPPPPPPAGSQPPFWPPPPGWTPPSESGGD